MVSNGNETDLNRTNLDHNIMTNMAEVKNEDYCSAWMSAKTEQSDVRTISTFNSNQFITDTHHSLTRMA